VTTANQRSALAALNHVRPIIARLDIARHAEDVAADLIEGWNGTEVALRSLLGGSALSGQALIRELRQREMLSLAQTHALMEFLAARERAGRTDYTPTAADIAAARHGFQELEGALTEPVETAAPLGVGPAAATTPGDTTVAVGGRRGPGRMMIIAAVVVALVGVGGFFAFQAFANRGTGNVTADGARLLAAGQRGEARRAFEDAAREHPKAAAPHIYLGRMAREDGDYNRALEELSMAVRLEPRNGLAQREMASYLFLRGNYPLASSFYTRAIQYNPSDKLAMGYLACAQARMGRMDAAIRFFDRAGPGDWSSCDPRRRMVPPPA
jgi:cytochrome c-type biogenesis protein CcmH/NrfG